MTDNYEIMKPRELANDPSKMKIYLESKIKLVEDASKKLDEALARRGVLFGHFPDDVSEEVMFSFFKWEGANKVFDRAQDIISKKRWKKLDKEGKLDDLSQEEASDPYYFNLYLNFCKTSTSYLDRVWGSGALHPCVKSGLVAKLRREKKLTYVIEDLELECLRQKLGVERNKEQFPNKENEHPSELRERLREWSRQQDRKMRIEILNKIKGPSHQIRPRVGRRSTRWIGGYEPVNYDWKLEREGKTHIVRMEIPHDSRKITKIRLLSPGKNMWIVGRAFFLNGSVCEWKNSANGPRISLVPAKDMPTSGTFTLFDFQSDKVLDPV